MFNYYSQIQKDAAVADHPPAAPSPQPVPQPLAFDVDFPDGAKKCSVTVPCFYTTQVNATSHKQAMGTVMQAVESMDGMEMGILELCQVEHSADTIAIPLIAVVNLPTGTLIPKEKLLQVCLNIIAELNQKHTKGGISFNALLPTSGEVTGSDDF